MAVKKAPDDIVDALAKELYERPHLQGELRALLGVPDLSIATAIRELAAAQARTDATVKELATEVKELAAAQARTDATVKELATEVKALAAAQARTDATVKELATEVKELAAAQARTELAVEKLAAAQKRTDRAVGALADNVGFSLEELAAIIMPDVLAAQEHIDGLTFERRYMAPGTDREEELDLYAEGTREGKRVTVVGEVKSRIYPREVEKFAARVERIRPFFTGEIVAVMFGFVVHPTATPIGRDLGIRLVASRPSRAA